jgi:hypothetical protein
MYPSHVVACRGIASCDSIRLVHGVVNGKRGSEGTKAGRAEMGRSFKLIPPPSSFEDVRMLAPDYRNAMLVLVPLEVRRRADSASLP